ncbi:uncharacterized protein LOC132053951 [Lycium ferocissimum]|uniref:uncharacterized protein LOC132053951 n=1 Tax=Lycium ferocissimum TaxID=112874 RepID=UPI00281691F3|nr:uncharacterized protein LOC132053951 [Lycium ferocissimum]
MKDYSSVSMQGTGNIIRRSIFIFLQNYQFFTTTAALLAFPFAVSVLLLQAFIPSTSFVRAIHDHLHALFDAAGLPSSSKLFTLLNSKLSQTIAISFLAFPFTFSSLLFAKASIFKALTDQKPSKKPAVSSFFSLYSSLLLTQLCTSLVIISANATCFTLLFFAFNIFNCGFNLSSPEFIFLISVTGAIIYSTVLASTMIICNLALVLSGIEKIGGYVAILKACFLIRGKTATALLLTLIFNLALAAVEALFQYRIVKAYHHKRTGFSAISLEGMFIAYLYAILLVLDTISSCLFFECCKTGRQMDEEGCFPYQIEIEDRDNHAVLMTNTLEELS